ncbi:hypothetical protein BV25DRAFT_1848315, partial [Artomyces pyxidatus]
MSFSSNPPLSARPFPRSSLFGQSAAQLVASSFKFPSSCPPLDALLDGGLLRGHILEISGPPGTAKETFAIDYARSAVKLNQGVLFVDMQNMTKPAVLHAQLQDHADLVHYLAVHALTDVIAFLHNLPAFLKTHESISFLVLNSLSFPFQTAPDLAPSGRHAVLAQCKQIFARLCAAQNVTIVITSQMSTKLLNLDGTPGNFESGSRAVLVPLLGSTYLPSGRAHRVVIVPETRTSGVLRLLASPRFNGDGPTPEMKYEMVRVLILVMTGLTLAPLRLQVHGNMQSPQS